MVTILDENSRGSRLGKTFADAITSGAQECRKFSQQMGLDNAKQESKLSAMIDAYNKLKNLKKNNNGFANQTSDVPSQEGNFQSTLQQESGSQPQQEPNDNEQEMIFDIMFPEVGKGMRDRQKIEQKERFHNEERMDKKTAPALEEARVKRQAMPSKKMSLSLFRNATNEGNVSYFSKSNLAGVLNNLTGDKFNLKWDASGAQLAFAGKNYLIENLDKVGAKGLNQYLEKQLSTAQPQIGASPQANNSILIPMETTVAIEDFYLDRLGQYEDMYDKLGKPLPYSAVRNAQKEAAQFADDQLKKMSYELRENQESTMSDSQIMDFGTKDNPKSVTPGTPLTERAATLFLKKYGFDEEDPESEKSLKSIKTALKVAKQLGYDVEVTE